MIKNIKEVTPEEVDEINLGQLISSVNRHFYKFVDKKLGEYDLTLSQAQFLLSIHQKDHISQEELSNQFNISEGTVARSMKRIEDKGLIIRKTNPEDKRKKVIIITEKGEEKIKEIIKNNEEMEKKIYSKLTKEEIQNLKVTLIKLVETLNQ